MRTGIQLDLLLAAQGRRALALDARDAILFGVCYFILDWASYLYPLGPFNITPWNPPPALSIVWMLLGGLRYAPVVFAAILTDELLIRHAPLGPLVGVATALVLASGYTGIAAAFRGWLRFDGRLRDTRQLWTFIGAIAVGVAIIGTVYVGVLWVAGFQTRGSILAAVFQFWLGDTVGVLVTAPLLLVAADPTARERLGRSWRRPETALQFGVLVAMVLVIFKGLDEPQNAFYPLFLPVIWIALRNGLGGAAAASAIVQCGAVLYAATAIMRGTTVLELQAVVSALTLTGLFLGVLTEERERALEDLKRSLRLAAAGEMASAIAHEINQPLAAMRNYGASCELMLGQGRGAEALPALTATIEKMLEESRRTAEVVGRLRDFFLSGTTRLDTVGVAELLAHAREIGAKLNASGEVAFRVESDDRGGELLVDRVQIELVLRNLIANAFDAVAGLPPGRRGVTVSTRQLGSRRIIIRVADTGAGVSPQVRRRLFEPFATRKATGMGIGLTFSRAIAEAHGGSILANDAQHGEFDLILPLETAND
jgi:signal transduction histidine kinase